MGYRPLDITVVSAKDLKKVNLMTKMDVYAVVSINGNPSTSLKTPVHKYSGPNPTWNHRMHFTVDDSAVQQDHLLLFKLVSQHRLGDRDIGEVRIPIRQLLAQNDARADQVAGYTVMAPNGKPKGTLDFSYRFGDMMSAPPAVDHHSHVGNAPSVAAYPTPPQSAGYPPQAWVPYAYPHAPTPPQAYATHPPPPPTYGYPGVQTPNTNGGIGAGLGYGLAGQVISGLLAELVFALSLPLLFFK